MSRYYTDNPCADAERWNDDKEALAESEEERQQELCDDFITAALRDVKALATFAQPYTAYNAVTKASYKRHQTVAEIMGESLDYTNGPNNDDLLQLLSDAARGEDIRPKALTLVQRMGAKYAEMNVVVV